ncbi:MAG: anti-sigma factor [Gaiellales bacterium]
MSDERRPLDDLIETLGGEDRARLERVHDLLVAAGPPPELPPSLESPPAPPTAKVVPLVRRYRLTAVAAAAVLALGVFGAGYLTGQRGPALDRSVPMAGANGARATIDVFEIDEAGNWPMELHVSGLPDLPDGKRYALWLTRNGKLADPCGTFRVAGGEADVPLNAPFKFREYTGWVVVEEGAEEFLLRTATV